MYEDEDDGDILTQELMEEEEEEGENENKMKAGISPYSISILTELQLYLFFLYSLSEKLFLFDAEELKVTSDNKSSCYGNIILICKLQ